MAEKLFTIDNWLGGIAESEKIGNLNEYAEGQCLDPTRAIGYMSAGFNHTFATNATAVMSKNINSFVIDPANNGGKYFGIEKGTKIHRGALVAYSLENGSDFPHTIGDSFAGVGHSGHTSIVGEDIDIFAIGDTQRAWYSWNDNTDGDIGSWVLGSTAFEDDYYTNTLGGSALEYGVPHQMVEHPGLNKLFILNGRYIAEIDGIDGTPSSNAFTLPAGWVGTTQFVLDDLVGICASYYPGTGSVNDFATRCAVFFWDGVEDYKYDRKIGLTDTKINASILIDGVPHLFCTSASGKGIIRRWNGSTFPIKYTGNNESRTPAGYGSVTEYKQGALFVTSDSYICYWGSPLPGTQQSLYNISRTYNVSSSGIINIAGTYLVSSGDNYLQYSGAGYNKNFVYRDIYRTMPEPTKVEYIVAYFAPLQSGAYDDIYLQFDDGDYSETLGTIKESDDSLENFKRFDVDKERCNNCRLIIDTNASSSSGIRYYKIDFYGTKAGI